MNNGSANNAQHHYRSEAGIAGSRQPACTRAALGAPTSRERLAALEALARAVAEGRETLPPFGQDVNNHIHTIYSFSPYSPTEAVWYARLAGLQSAGIMDHDSIAGAPEFVRAGEILGLATTVGVECRADFGGTRLRGRSINNPDQAGIAYMAIHGIPPARYVQVAAYFAPRIEARHVRNRRMLERLGTVLSGSAWDLDYEADVLPLSQARNGGTVTERHLLFALTQRVLAVAETPRRVVRILEEDFALSVPESVRGKLADVDNPWPEYDLLGFLKGTLLKRCYLPADAECPAVADVVGFAREIGAIPAYAYLGDVTVSVTGDKAAQAFEDEYLDELFEELVRLGFPAVTYMPSRNTPAQRARVRDLCRQWNLLEISGEDINSPRQSFVCEAQRAPECAHLNEAAWALIGHEREAALDESRGFFSSVTCAGTVRVPDFRRY